MAGTSGTGAGYGASRTTTSGMTTGAISGTISAWQSKCVKRNDLNRNNEKNDNFVSIFKNHTLINDHKSKHILE